MRIDESKFFAGIRSLFRPMSQEQVDCIKAILGAWVYRYHRDTSIPQFAAVLATAYHETARTMRPLHEYGDRARFMRMYDPSGARPKVAATLGNTQVGDGALFAGRGYVQLTGRGNYRKATQKLRALGIIGADIDFERDPGMVMQPEYALPILFIGMEQGWFTGRKLDTIVDDRVDGNEEAQFVRSRSIINGTDREKLIAGYAMTFLRALVASVTETADIAPPVVKRPEPINLRPGAGAWNSFWSAVSDLVKV